jgi:hypothetical protein
LFATGNRISTRCTVHLQLGSSRCHDSNAIVFREEHLPNGGGWKARPGLDRRRHLNEATCRLPQTRKQERFEWHKRIRETSSCAAASVRLLAKCKPASRARCGERVTRRSVLCGGQRNFTASDKPHAFKTLLGQPGFC